MFLFCWRWPLSWVSTIRSIRPTANQIRDYLWAPLCHLITPLLYVFFLIQRNRRNGATWDLRRTLVRRIRLPLLELIDSIMRTWSSSCSHLKSSCKRRHCVEWLRDSSFLFVWPFIYRVEKKCVDSSWYPLGDRRTLLITIETIERLTGWCASVHFSSLFMTVIWRS